MKELLESYLEREINFINTVTKSEVWSKDVFSMDFQWKEENISVCIHPPVANHRPEEPLHQHDYFEFVYMYRGKAVSYFKDSETELNSGDLLLMNLNTHHGCSIDNPDCILVNIMIRKNFLRDVFLPMLSANNLFFSFFSESLFIESPDEQYLLFTKNDSEKLEMLLDSFLLEYYEKKSCYQTALQSYLCLIFSELLRLQINRFELYESKKNLFAELHEYMNDHLVDISLPTMAEHFHYSPTQMSKLIKKYTHRTFSELLTELRMNKAKTYLTGTTLSIDTIADLVGYYDRSYFNKTFKKCNGITPSEFRNI